MIITQATANALYDALYELVAAAQEGYDTVGDRAKNDRAINREIAATKVAIDVLHKAAGRAAMIKELIEAANDLIEDFEQYLEVCMDERERESIVAMKDVIKRAEEELE